MLFKFFDFLTFALLSNFLEQCFCHGPGLLPNFQSTHQDAPVPADYPHQDEQFARIVSGIRGHVKGQRPQVTSPKAPQEIFLSDRVVKAICRTLETFVETGVAPTGRIKRSSVPGSDRCGWWKSSGDCPLTDESCGFDWVDCRDIDSSPGPQTGNSNLPISDSASGNTDSSDRARSSGVPGDESELNLQLPSSAEWQRRFNSSNNGAKDDD